MFETVNDRGRPLTDLEKTKSILMYASYLVLDDSTALDALLSDLNDHFAEIYRSFEAIEERLGLPDAGEIQRYHHVFFTGAQDSHKHIQILKDPLMGKSREDREDCERFIRSYSSSLRQAFETMQDIAKRRRDGSQLGDTVHRLFLVGRVGNLYPLLIAAWQKFRKDYQRAQMLRLFRSLRIPSLSRCKSPRQHRAHPDGPDGIHRDAVTFSAFRKQLREMNRHYANDDAFRRALSHTHCYQSLCTRTIKYLLAQYETELRSEAQEALPASATEILSSEYETEHILPQNPKRMAKWRAAAHEEIVHRIGNLTVASKAWNRNMGNRPFAQEKAFYGKSSMRVQRDLAREEKWNKSFIQKRGKKIIEFALKRWRIGPAY